MGKSKTSKGKSAREEDEVSEATRAYHLSRHEKDSLRGEIAHKRYTTDFLNREILLGRYVDFEWMSKENEINVDFWMANAGWAHFLNVNETVYPRLVRILYANLDMNSLKSRIGDVVVDLNAHVWEHHFGLPHFESEEEEREIMEITKDELFRNLNGKINQGYKSWINANELPGRLDDRLLVSILMNAIIPKRGSREQLREEEARILYSVKHGLKFNIGREIIKRIEQVFSRKNTPLVYPMHLMIIMKAAGVNLKAAGDIKLDILPPSLHINEKTPPRLGFKREGFYWTFIGKGKGKYTGENVPGEEQVRTDRTEERREEEEQGAASSIPHTYTSYPTQTPTQQPHITHHLAIFETQLLSKITQIFDTRMTHHLALHLNPINSGLQTLNTRIDDLQTELRNLATKIHHPPSPSPSPSHPEPQPQSSPTPNQPPSPQPHTQPEPQSTSQPPPQTNIPFIDLTNPLDPPSFPADHFSTATYLNTPSPHPDIPPTEPHQYPAAHYSETSDSERTPSPQPSSQPTPSATPSATPTVPSLPAARRLKKMAKKPKRTLPRRTPEVAQAQPPQDQAATPSFNPSTRLEDLSNVFSRKRFKTSQPKP